MCSSLLGLGGTHVQQCSECRISRICVSYSRRFKRNSIAASSQHHAGLQPANLVTSTLGSCSRSWTFSSRTRIFRVFRQFWPARRDGVNGELFFFSSVLKIFRVFRNFWPGRTRWGRLWLDVRTVRLYPYFLSDPPKVC